MDFFNNLFNSGTIESHYLQMIGLLDRTETMSCSLLEEEAIDHAVILQISRTKQMLIEEFARMNRIKTLGPLEEKFKEED